MKITNNHGLPEPIVEAVRRDPYNAGECDISCTTLIGPPMIRHLELEHGDEIEEDAADRIWALLGQSVHTILERAGVVVQPMKERRMFSDFRGRTVSGQVDLFDNGGVLSDYKTTSVWAVMNGLKPEWEAQVNVLAELARRNGHDPRKLEIVALLRDWRKGERLRSTGDYPDVQTAVLPVEMWSPPRVTEYIEERLRLHFDAPPAVCSPAERWDKPTTYAVMSKGRKTAHRVLESAAAADDWMAANGKGDTVEVRPGESTRCLHYCSVRRWCPYGSTLESEAKMNGSIEEG